MTRDKGIRRIFRQNLFFLTLFGSLENYFKNNG
jgi:hypothetical protein